MKKLSGQYYVRKLTLISEINTHFNSIGYIILFIFEAFYGAFQFKTLSLSCIFCLMKTISNEDDLKYEYNHKYETALKCELKTHQTLPKQTYQSNKIKLP